VHADDPDRWRNFGGDQAVGHGEALLPQDGMGVREEDKQYCDALSRHAEGPWRTNYRSPLYVPPEFRQGIDPSWFDELWTQHEAQSKEDAAEKEMVLRPFRVMQPDGTEWEQRIWERLEAKMANVPHDMSVFGSRFSQGTKFELESIRLIFQEEMNDVYSQVELQHDAEDMLTFHGTRLSNLRPILKNGFDPTTSRDGWYGNGCYFTNNIPYSQHYIKRVNGKVRGKHAVSGIQLPEPGNIVYVLACFLRPGRVKVVPPDTTPSGSGYIGPYRDKGCDPDFDSHAAWVTPESEGNFGFRPVKEEQVKEDPKRLVIKEYVMFQRERILPRFIIGMRRIS